MNAILRTAPGLMVLVLGLAFPAVAQSGYTLLSPDKRIEVRVRTAERIQYDVLLNGKVLLQDCALSLNLDHKVLGINAQVKSATKRSYDQEIEPVVRQKFAKIREHYNELRLEMDGDYAVVFRAYNEGAAYRLETSLALAEVKIFGEEVNLRFDGDYSVFFRRKTVFSHTTNDTTFCFR
jgi:alpha-glucosidase